MGSQNIVVPLYFGNQFLKENIMANKEKAKHLNAKQQAYAEKQEKEGRSVVNWIFGILILCAAAFCAYSIYAFA